MKALIVVDMQHDFTYGKFRNERAIEIIDKINKVIAIFRRKKLPIIFTRDAHIKHDKEFEIWGEHAVKGTAGYELAKGLDFRKNDMVINKRSYDAFFNTDLDGILREKNVKDIFICGIATHVCVLHTVAGAFFRGYRTYIIRDCITSFDERWHELGIEYLSLIHI